MMMYGKHIVPVVGYNQKKEVPLSYFVVRISYFLRARVIGNNCIIYYDDV